MLDKVKAIEGVKDAAYDEASRVLTVKYTPQADHNKITEMQLQVALTVGTSVQFIMYEAV